MAATAADISTLRRYVNEPTAAGGYDDTTLAGIIERYPLPYTDAGGTTWYPGDALWQARYDLNRAASDVWGEKAAAVAHKHTIHVDGTILTASQVQQQYRQMSDHYRRKAVPVSVRVHRG